METVHVSRKERARIASALNRCEEAASDLERFLGHAAADAREPELHTRLYDAAKVVGLMPIELRRALVAAGAFAELGGTARGALRRAALEARVAILGRDDAAVLREVEAALLDALSEYDAALESVVGAPDGYVGIVVGQRKTISRLCRELVGRASCPEH